MLLAELGKDLGHVGSRHHVRALTALPALFAQAEQELARMGPERSEAFVEDVMRALARFGERAQERIDAG